MTGFAIGMAVGFIAGLAIDWKARRERDERIKELEQTKNNDYGTQENE